VSLPVKLLAELIAATSDAGSPVVSEHAEGIVAADAGAAAGRATAVAAATSPAVRLTKLTTA
jgi:hypothetical protein